MNCGSQFWSTQFNPNCGLILKRLKCCRRMEKRKKKMGKKHKNIYHLDELQNFGL